MEIGSQRILICLCRLVQIYFHKHCRLVALNCFPISDNALCISIVHGSSVNFSHTTKKIAKDRKELNIKSYLKGAHVRVRLASVFVFDIF